MSDEEKKSETKNKLIEYLEELMKPENVEDLKRFGVGMATIIVSCSILYIATTDPKALTEQFYFYCFFVIMPVIIGGLFASNMLGGGVGTFDETKLFFYGGILFVFIISAYLFRRIINPGSVIYITYLLGILSILVFIVGLAIIYRIFVRTIINMRGWTGFFFKFLFLIPCLLIEFLETVFAELKVAPKMIIVLFILEILIILAYIYLPRITNPSSDAIILLDKPVFLSRLKSIGNATQFYLDKNSVDNPSKSDTEIRTNYSISMWFYVNQHPNTNAAYSKETNIFRFGYPGSSNGHPRIAYYNDITNANKSDKFIVYVNNADDSSGVLLDIPTQSWNNLVITYNESSVDIFVNGNLEKSISLVNKKRPLYEKGDIVEVGYGDNTVLGGGLHGAICNVVYYKNPLTTFQIAGNYNINRYKNPPVN
jgi:hypothetical protein